MKQETWNKKVVDLFLLRLYPEDLTLFDKMMFSQWEKGIAFIRYLLKKGISLTRIDTNDWSASVPRIYVDGWCYKRMSKYDMDRALNRAKSRKN